MDNYLGAKNGSGVYQAIINLIPPHDTYVECFLGTGAIMKRKAPALRNIGLDLNKKCVDKCNYTAVNVELHQMNAFDFLRSFDFESNGRVTLYLDPPYVHSTRTSNKRYKHELTDDEHRELLNILLDLSCNIIISGYRNPIYDELIGEWWSFDFQTMTRGGVRTETVWCNFTPNEMHFHTYAGKDSLDRQRIKRKAKRWANNFSSLPSGEQQVILSEMLQILAVEQNNNKERKND